MPNATFTELYDTVTGESVTIVLLSVVTIQFCSDHAAETRSDLKHCNIVTRTSKTTIFNHDLCANLCRISEKALKLVSTMLTMLWNSVFRTHFYINMPAECSVLVINKYLYLVDAEWQNPELVCYMN